MAKLIAYSISSGAYYDYKFACPLLAWSDLSLLDTSQLVKHVK